jgi:hypothetical protein
VKSGLSVDMRRLSNRRVGTLRGHSGAGTGCRNDIGTRKEDRWPAPARTPSWSSSSPGTRGVLGLADEAMRADRAIKIGGADER